MYHYICYYEDSKLLNIMYNIIFIIVCLIIHRSPLYPLYVLKCIPFKFNIQLAVKKKLPSYITILH